LGKFCERDFGRSIRVVDGGSENSWVVFPRRSAVILSLLCQQLKHCWYSAPCPNTTVVSNSNGRKAKKVRRGIPS
jgi:hypothetical protein